MISDLQLLRIHLKRTRSTQLSKQLRSEPPVDNRRRLLRRRFRKKKARRRKRRKRKNPRKRRTRRSLRSKL